MQEAPPTPGDWKIEIVNRKNMQNNIHISKTKDLVRLKVGQK